MLTVPGDFVRIDGMGATSRRGRLPLVRRLHVDLMRILTAACEPTV